jgi:hypothetical protein
VTYYHSKPSDWPKFNLEAYVGGAVCLAPMLSTGKIHVYTSTLLLILTISLYLSIYRGLLPSAERALFAQSSSAEAPELPNLALELHPKDHIHRDPRKHHYTWNITSGLRAPDGVVKELYLINGLVLQNYITVNRKADKW